MADLPKKNPEILVCLSPRKVTKFLFFVILGFFFFNLLAQLNKYLVPDYPFRDSFIYYFSVDNEISFPTLYSMFALQFCALLLFLIAYVERAGKISKKALSRPFAALGIIFLYLSLDEMLGFHEQVIDPIHAVIDVDGFFYFAWVIPGMLFVLIVLLSFLKFLLALPADIRKNFLLAGSIFVGGAIGIEMVGAYILTRSYSAFAFETALAFEEFLEMLGIVVFIYGLLSYLKSQIIEIKVFVQGSQVPIKQTAHKEKLT